MARCVLSDDAGSLGEALEYAEVAMITDKSILSPRFFAAVAAVVVVSGMLVGANTAAADSIQYQSYQRDSQSEECVGLPDETPWQASWGPDSSWTPTWEMWPNDGTGGWTCSRSIAWAGTSAQASNAGGPAYNLGDIGPGGGLVFLISGGLTYEMAPNTWSGGSSDPGSAWCNTSTLLSGAFGTAIGDGAQNTALMVAGCSSGAGQLAASYNGGGFTDWFLPSKDELNAMCNYARTWAGAPSTGACSGAQDSTFETGVYGFWSGITWSSSQFNSGNAWDQRFSNGAPGTFSKATAFRVRPIRAF